jgi:hypothetical protein
MNFKNVFPISAMLLVGLMSSCSNQLDSGVSSKKSSNDHSSSEQTGNVVPVPPVQGAGTLATVNLGVANSFAILSKSGITNVYKSSVSGDIGSSPITGAAILLTCPEVNGSIFTVDAAGPLPCRTTNPSMLTTAVSNMEAAYTDAAGRTNPTFLNLGAGNIGGKTLTPGLYKWTTALTIPANVTISGGATDIFIFQVAGTLTMASAVRITLTGGAQAKNIFWQTSGAVTLGTTSHFEGNILGKTGINLQTGASMNGRLLAQTAVTLQKSTVTIPQ